MICLKHILSSSFKVSVLQVFHLLLLLFLWPFVLAAREASGSQFREGPGFLNRTVTNQVEMIESVSSFLKFLCCQRSQETKALIDNQ